MKKIALAALLISGAACISAGKAPSPSFWAASNPAWVEPVEPFRVHGEVFYIGTRGLSSFLIATPEGHFLIDGGMPENAGLIAKSVKALGYDIRDVKYLLNSHAHFDHSGGLAALKAMTGATMVASEGDRSALEGGFYLGSEDDADLAAPPVKVDRTIGDGQSLTLGEVSLSAHLTPGHTRGCTSWTMNSGGKEVLFFCSATVAANRLVDPPQYDGIVADYRATFAKTKTWRPDIFLSNHPEVFDLAGKRERQIGGINQAFVDPGAFSKYIEAAEAAFERALAEQTAKAQSK